MDELTEKSKLVIDAIKKMYHYEVKEYDNGIEIKDSYQEFFNRGVINQIYKGWNWKRSKFSLYVEWAIHTLCYWLNIKRERAQDVYFEFDKSWFNNLFKKQ